MISKQYFDLKRVKNKLTVIPWIFIVTSIIIAFFVFYYFDVSDTLDNSLVLIDAVVHKQFFNYYDYAITNAASTTIYTANYNLPLYILFAIWNSPFYIMKKLWGLDGIRFELAIMWCKVLIMLASVGCVFVMNSILKETGYEKKSRKYVPILFFSSSSLFMGAYIAIQYDVITLLFILIGIDAFLKKQGKKFLFIFMIAVPFKTFALFIFIPLLLLKEKKVIRIVGSLIVSYSLIIIEKIMFWKDPAYELCLKSQNKDAIDLIVVGNLQIGTHGLSIFIMIFVAVCAYCYMKSEDLYLSEEQEIKRQLLYYVAYIGLFVFVVFFVTIDFRSYWLVLYLPFAILLIIMNSNRLWINIMIETIGSAVGVIYFLTQHWIYSVPELCTMLWLPKLINMPEEACRRYSGIGGFLKGSLAEYSNVLVSIFAACMLLLLIINRPKYVNLEKNDCNFGRSEYEGLLFRSIIPFCITIMIIYVSLQSQNTVMLNTIEEPFIQEQSITSNNTYEQRFVASEERNLESVVLMFSNPEMYKKNRDFIVFSFVSVKDNKVMYQKKVGAPLIKDNEKYRIGLKGVHVEAGQTYEIKIERYDKTNIVTNEDTIDKVHTKTNDVFPYCTDVINADMDKLMINGKYVEKQLFMILR